MKRADIEWLLAHQKEILPPEQNFLSVGWAKIEQVSFRGLQLKGIGFYGVQLEGANFMEGQLEGANFTGAQLKGADFTSAYLGRTSFTRAQLKGADFTGAQLEGAQLADRNGVEPVVVDVRGWGGVNLAAMEWSQIRQLGDEVKAKKKRNEAEEVKEKTQRVDEHRRAARAYRQVTTALEEQGLKEEAEIFAYRARLMQRQMLWWRIGEPG